MPPKPAIKVVKVPLQDHERPKSYEQSFPRMPRMYLELIENKAKIKQDLINKEHLPNAINEIVKPRNSAIKEEYSPSPEKSISKHEEKLKNIDKLISEETKIQTESTSFIPDSPPKSDNELDLNQYNSRYDKDEIVNKKQSKNKELEKEIDDLFDSSKDDDFNQTRVESTPKRHEINIKDNLKSLADNHDSSHIIKKPTSNLFDKRLDKLLGNITNNTNDEERYEDKSPSITSEPEQSLRHRYESPKLSDNDDKYSNRSVESNMSTKLKRLLQSESSPAHQPQKLSSHNHDKLTQKSQTQTLPPSLADIEASGGIIRKKELRDINHIPISEDQEDDAKRELMFKFELLKKSYPNSTIPEFTVHSDYQTMKKSYEQSVRRLSLDSSVETYKTYLIGAFMASEYIFGHYLGFDMQGFTQQQILSMNSYEKLLIELGEKSYVPKGSKWPVEIRLLMLIIINSAFFIVSKMLLKKTGTNILGMINNMNTANINVGDSSRTKRKMRGPDINLSDFE